MKFTQATKSASDPDLQSRLLSETATIQWPELERHFARGVVVKVSTELNLVDAVTTVIRDDLATVESWLSSGTIARASDDDARDWTTREPEFWCVVAAPWVFVQEK